MAKGKYADWLAPESLAVLEGWARDGLTDEQLAHNIGIAQGTLHKWKKEHEEIGTALKKGADLKKSKEEVDYQVENALYEKAMGGNVAAMTFWLKNRRPDKWRDKPERAEEGTPPEIKVIIASGDFDEA